MQQEINQQRIQSIHKMLFEMAAGNFRNRIQRTKKDDEVEAMAVLVNMVAEELEVSFFNWGFINPHHSFTHLVQGSFILDSNFIIRSYSLGVSSVFGFTDETLYNTAFGSILSEESSALWDSLKENILGDAMYTHTLQLTYINEKQLLVPCCCSISRLKHSSAILISMVTTVVDDTLAAKPLVSTEGGKSLDDFVSYAEVQVIQHVYDYILKHLYSPLPSLKNLSQLFGTNDHKLKYGFKLIFKTTIYQFYTNERLKRAHLLIQETNISLKRIAIIMGFKSYSHFSRIFKQYFGCSPNAIVRRAKR